MPELEHEFANGWTLRGAYRYADGSIDVLNATLGSYVDPATAALVDPWSTPNALHSDRTSTTQSFNVVATGKFPLFGREHEAVLGYNSARNEFTLRSRYADLPTVTLNHEQVPAPDLSLPSSPYDADATEDVSTQSGFYGTLRLKLMDRLKLMAGGRLSQWELESRDADTGALRSTAEATDVFTPYFGVVFDLNDYASIYASHTGIFLPGTYYGADGKLLEPTDGTNDEFGVKLAFHDNRLNVSAAIYEANKDNVPEWANQGQLPNGEWIYMSIDGIETRGYEVEIAGALTPQWQISGGFTHNTANDRQGNARNTYVPEDVFKITTTYSLERGLPGLRIGGSARWQSDTWYDFTIALSDPEVPVRQQQPAYWLLDLMASYAVSDTVSLTLNVANVLDETYQRSLWGYTDAGSPRDWSLTVRWRM